MKKLAWKKGNFKYGRQKDVGFGMIAVYDRPKKILLRKPKHGKGRDLKKNKALDI